MNSNSKYPMQILDRYGYLESALEYIDRNIASGKGLHKIAKKTGISENSLRTLSLSLKDFSEKQIFTMLGEKLENRHTSLSGASAEVSGADISIEKDERGVFALLNVAFDIVADGDMEDKATADIKFFSKNNIQIDL